ncbi:hypothetical protein HIM_04428 [Hirsutella minnesotensis 3608]|uniref:Uncharacterized protein n=1 Tax=Hirsutella minnesotensis 3608 TaxID=1043627 RepID=A0A0F7ZLF9_9HYPO|nr:hypothetical protein HIM_04428 [Hirsutella minnesotensis 3608]
MVVALAGDALFLTLTRKFSGPQLFALFVTLWSVQLVIWGLWSTFVWPHYMSPLRNLPHPGNSHWLLGHYPQVGVFEKRKWATIYERTDFIRTLGVFNRETLLVTSPKAISEILVSKNYNFPKAHMSRHFARRYVGHGILDATGKEHKTQRRKFAPVFAFGRIRHLYATFWDKAGEATTAMTAACKSGRSAKVDIHAWAVRCTLDIIGKAGMDVDFGAIQNENNAIIQSYADLHQLSWQDAILTLLSLRFPEWFVSRIPLQRNRVFSKSMYHIRKACQKAIQSKKRMMDEKQQSTPDICSTALESGLFASDERLTEQLMGFLFTGHHTTAKALTAAIYALCCFPEKQRLLREEIRQVLPPVDGTGEICGDDIENMPYLNAVCKEVLRKYIEAESTREAACEIMIQGQVIPRGTTIVLSSCYTNTDPVLWGEDANEFKPERWLEDSSGNGGATSNYAFLSFMHGPQSCIATRYALGELACLVAAWIGRLEFSLCDKELLNEGKLPPKALESQLCVQIRVVEGWP